MLASTLAITYSNSSQSGHGSVGRAQPCQGWGRGFEPRCPLHCISGPSQAVLFRRSGQVVRQRPAKPLPPVRIRASPPGNIRALRRPFCFTYADMAQLVEHNLAKVGVAGSSPVVRSKRNSPTTTVAGFFRTRCFVPVAWPRTFFKLFENSSCIWVDHPVY